LQTGTAHLWSRPPEGPGYVDRYIDDHIAQEHCASVRVIELPQEGKRFILVYPKGRQESPVLQVGDELAR